MGCDHGAIVVQVRRAEAASRCDANRHDESHYTPRERLLFSQDFGFRHAEAQALVGPQPRQLMLRIRYCDTHSARTTRVFAPLDFAQARNNVLDSLTVWHMRAMWKRRGPGV